MFDETQHRTAKINEAAELVYLIFNELGGNKNGKEGSQLPLSRFVLKTGLLSNHFIEDLKRIACLNAI